MRFTARQRALRPFLAARSTTMYGTVTEDSAGRSLVGALPPLWIRLRPAALRRLMRLIHRAAHRPAYPPAHCGGLPLLLLYCERSDCGLNGLTPPTSSSCSRARYKSNQRTELLADTSSSLLHAQAEPVDAQRAVALECVRRSGACGVPHGESGTHACEPIAYNCRVLVC